MTKLVQRVTFGALALWAIAMGGSAGASAATPDEMLQKLEEQFKNVRSYYHKTTTTNGEGKTAQKIVAEIWMQRDGSKVKVREEQRIDTNAPQSDKPGKGGKVTVCDGEYSWTETTIEGQVITLKMPAVEHNPLEDVHTALRRGKPALKPDEMVGDQKCVVFEVDMPTARRDNRAITTFYISKRDGLLIKVTSVDGQGRRSEMVTDELKVNERIPADRFAYTPAEGAKVMDITQGR